MTAHEPRRSRVSTLIAACLCRLATINLCTTVTTLPVAVVLVTATTNTGTAIVQLVVSSAGAHLLDCNSVAPGPVIIAAFQFLARRLAAHCNRGCTRKIDRVAPASHPIT